MVSRKPGGQWPDLQSNGLCCRTGSTQDSNTKKPSIFNPLDKPDSNYEHLKCISIIKIYFLKMAFCTCSDVIYNALKRPLC